MPDQATLDALTGNLLGRAAEGAEGAPPAQPAPDLPPNVRSLRPEPADGVPPAPARTAPSEDDPELPAETLAERVERAVNPGPVTDADPEPAPPGDPAQPQLSERELQLQRERDELAAFKTQVEQAQEVATFEDTWAEVWDQGYAQFQQMAQGKAREMQQAGHSQEEIDSWVLRNVLPRQQQWEAQVAANERAATQAFYATRGQPSQVDQLLTQHGLGNEDRATLAKYQAHPDVMKQVAADIAAERARVAHRDQAVVRTARDQRAQEFSERAFEPGAPGAPAGKKPWSGFTAEDFASGRAQEAMSTVLLSRARRSVPGMQRTG